MLYRIGQHRFSPSAFADWGKFCSQIMLLYMEGCSKTGGPSKIVVINSKYGERKYSTDHPVKGQCLFGAAECESGISYRSGWNRRNLDGRYRWIETGTTVISECRDTYRDLNTQSYTHHPVNHSNSVRSPGTHTNTTESTWCHVKAYLRPYNRRGATFTNLYICGNVQGRGSASIHKLPTPCRHNEIQPMFPRPFRIVRQVR